ncbi:uncharacterized protein STEHIDRAFT_53681 [Stereum hirsutum FP-91666 SS1]|uniref:uncharacterized protein n=1 Tax=Stereum hirsutum (strain FP-91666) TaxID=721885 RepID=UPI000440AF8C|nr:uncharacterized protein STEHIDRAFT_53681 [Stereum hirsutum FP-91666 SS1]EIM89154.1 hypothetical protein STEHIDRAFT_53681 [Stereum hirsutum FP-91666 SS1]
MEQHEPLKTTENLPHDPSKLYFEKPRLRRVILLSYWVVVLLATPLWWYTTSIERLSLPISHIHAQSDKQLVFPVHVQIDNFTSSLTDVPSIESIQQALSRQASLDQSSNVDIHVATRGENEPLSPDTYGVSIIQGINHPIIQDRRLSIPSSQATTPIASQTSDYLSALLFPHRTSRSSNLVAKYSPRYRLAFTFLNEDAADGNAVVGWEVEKSISHHLSSILDQLSELYNFTIESQIRFHAPLAFEPQAVANSDGNEVHGLTPEDLTVFVNSAEWTLSSSVSNDPVLHFVLFMPSARHSPLRILDAKNNPTSSNAFILPQWGGIMIFNLPIQSTTNTTSAQLHLTTHTLTPAFQTFKTQLLALLGVPALPPSIQIQSHAQQQVKGVGINNELTDWQLDALYRMRAQENAVSSKETLMSIAKLVDEIPNMPVGQDVKGDVQGALAELDLVYTTSPTSPTLILRHSAEALTLASRAFFNPGMLALLYFPAEHKYAVYTPLFAPVAVPLIVTVIREFKAWREGRRKRKEGMGKEVEGEDKSE